MVVLVAARLEPVETKSMTPKLSPDSEERLTLAKTEEEEVVAALRTSMEDSAAGRWISLEDYEAQTLAERQTRNAMKDDK